MREETEMLTETGEPKTFLWVGHQLWLDWINTEIVAGGERVSLIADYADLRTWLLASGAFTAEELARIEVGTSGRERAELVRGALAWRGELRRLAQTITSGEAIGANQIAAINRWLGQRTGTLMLEKQGEDWRLTTRYAYAGLEGLLAPVAASVAELLAGGDLSRVHKCESPDCILFYYDTSRNRTRHWCRMDACGNRHKAAAHYARRTGKTQTAAS